MRTVYAYPKHERIFAALTNYKLDDKTIQFSEKEIQCLRQAQVILDKASDIYSKASQCDAHDDPYFVAWVEVGYALGKNIMKANQ